MGFLIDKEYRLSRFPGKGGWTYTKIPEIAQNPENPFGWVKVSGFIDSFELTHYKLMPMGKGKLFLPVKAAIRKQIKKEAGDVVRVRLNIDNSILQAPDELSECLLNESSATLLKFNNLSEGTRKSYIDWIYDAKTDKTKAERIIKLIEDLEK